MTGNRATTVIAFAQVTDDLSDALPVNLTYPSRAKSSPFDLQHHVLQNKNHPFFAVISSSDIQQGTQQSL